MCTLESVEGADGQRCLMLNRQCIEMWKASVLNICVMVSLFTAQAGSQKKKRNFSTLKNQTGAEFNLPLWNPSSRHKIIIVMSSTSAAWYIWSETFSVKTQTKTINQTRFQASTINQSSNYLFAPVSCRKWDSDFHCTKSQERSGKKTWYFDTFPFCFVFIKHEVMSNIFIIYFCKNVWKSNEE